MPVRFRGDGGTVELSSLGGSSRVVVNILYRPRIFAWVDGRPATVAADEWGRAVVEVPAGTARLEFRYCPAWESTLPQALGLAALAVVLAWFLSRRRDVLPSQA